MRFAKEFPDELRSQIAASEVVSKRVSLKKHGKEHTGLCPFHNEKTPSFTVNDQKGFYHCFGCAAHGDIITFVMQTDGLDFKETVLKLADDYGIAVPIIEDNRDNQYQEKQDREYLILEKICQFFEDNLFQKDGVSALEYVKHRGLSQANIKKFRLGFAQDSYDSLINYLKKEGFTDPELIESGAVSRNDNGKIYDKFRNRVIFPISDKRGKIVAFGGRILGDGQPKYLNSPETNLFKKGKMVYNYPLARAAAYEQKFICIVEGYMDVISLDVAGIDNSVAPMGTAVTTDQMKELFRITEDVVICLDGDVAGRNAMRRITDIVLPLIDAKNIVRFAFLPAKSDPDDFVKSNGKKALQDLLKNAKNLSEVIFDYEAQDLGIADLEAKIAPEKKVQLENKLMAKVDLISDVNSKKYFSQYYRNRLFEIGKKIFTKKVNNVVRNKINIIDDIDLTQIYALNIIMMLIRCPKLVDYQDQYYNIREFFFEDEDLTNLKEYIIDFIDQNNDFTLNEIKDHIDKFSLDSSLKRKISLNSDSSYDLDSAKVRLEILILKYHHHQVSKQYKEILSKIDEVQTNEVCVMQGKQREIFDHKTSLERKILRLESEIT